MNYLIDMPEGAEFIIRTLQNKGFEAYAVGGCVRDSLLGKSPDDWDITTSAEPDVILTVFKKAGCTVVPTGVKHGTVTVIFKKKPYEVTTYRIDGVYTDGRRPENVMFTANLTEDLKRRDFTINAMAYSAETGLVDLFDGRGDLSKGIIKCVGNAGERFAEDYLRMLRAYRFAAVLGFKLDAEAYDTIIKNKQRINQISAERIRAELDKILVKGCMDGISLFFDDFLPIIIFEVDRERLDFIKSVFKNTENSLNVRLSVLFYGLSEDSVSGVMKRLKYDNKTTGRVRDILKFASGIPTGDKADIKNILFEIGTEAFVELNHLQKAIYVADGSDGICKADYGLFEKRAALLDEIIMNGEPFTYKDLAVTGSDLMKHTGKKPGIWLGEQLKYLLGEVIREPKLNDKEILLSMVNADI